jgi:membrane associated rhomboid family serine protease
MTRPTGLTSRKRETVRTLGIGVLGVIGGLLFAIVLQDVLAHDLIDAAGTLSVLGIVLGVLLPVFGILGGGLAIWIDHLNRRKRAKGPTDD